jgi:hypothetical protein
MSSVNFDAPAILQKENVGHLGNGQYGITHIDQVSFGPLAEVVYSYDNKPEREKPRYSILTSDSARIGKTQLEPRDIELLIQQPNYPLRGF